MITQPQEIQLSTSEGLVTLDFGAGRCFNLTVQGAELLAQWICDTCDEADPPAERDPAIEQDLARVNGEKPVQPPTRFA